MKICFINPAVGTITGGTETIVYQFANHLSERHEVTVLTGRSKYKPLQINMKKGAFNLITVPYWPRFTTVNNFITRLIRRLDPYKTESLSLYLSVILRPKIKKIIKEMDVVSTHYRLDSRLFSNLSHKLGVPSVFNIQMGPYGKEFFEKDKSTLYIANSHFSKDYIERNDKVKIHGIVTPGIPSGIFTNEYPRVTELKDSQSILYVGRLEPNKGVFELLEIYQDLIKFYPKLKLVYVGEGESKEMLIERVHKQGLKNVMFSGGIPYEKVFSYYKSTTILVHPSISETFGITILEAMAAGLPVVASDVPAIREVAGDAAVLLPVGNKKIWINRIREVLENQELRAKISKLGVEKTKEFFWEKKAKEYEEYLFQVVNDDTN